MNTIFFQILNMSLAAGYVILAVMFIRLLLRKAPKKYSYLLWIVVGFRLCCPFSFEAPYSLFNLGKLLPDQIGESLPVIEHYVTGTDASVAPGYPSTNSNNAFLTGNTISDTTSPNTTPITTGNSILINIMPTEAPDTLIVASPNREFFSFENLIVWIWIAGIAALILYSLLQYIKLRRELRTSILLKENIYQSDNVCSPFILGLMKPKIYIPFGLEKNSLTYVLEHEQYHIKRRDYLIKPFAFALLCLHWFNPLCWLAFHLMCKDMEMSCDEKVLSLGESSKAYSTTLLSFATNRRFPSPGPLAFGESGAKSRIKNALNWKRPGIWVTIVATIICTVTIVVCITNPSEDTTTPSDDIFLSQDDNTTASDTKDDSGTTPGTAFAFEYNNTFASMEDYASQKMEQLIGSTIEYYSLSQESPVSTTITNAKIHLLEKIGEIANLIPDGTLELWAFHYLTQVDAYPKDIILVGGQDEPEKGWYSLLGSDSGNIRIIALRQNDGTYRLLECLTNDSMFLFDNGHRNVAEALYDWGINHYQLDLPLNTKMLTTEDGYSGYYWRIDGDGWYFYQFAPSHDYWTQSADGSFSWTSKLGFTFSVAKLECSAKEETEALISRESVEEDANCIHVKHAKSNIEDYYYDAPEGGCYRVRTDYRIDIAPTIDPNILDVMARSFVITSSHREETGTQIPTASTEPFSDLTKAVSEFLSSLEDSALSAITLNQESTDEITYRHPSLADNARFYTNCLNYSQWFAVLAEQDNLFDSEISVTLSNDFGAQLTAFQGSNQLLFENSEGRWLLHAFGHEYAENEIYVILRGWFDEVEYKSLILKYGYNDFTLPDRGQNYLEAGAEAVQIMEELHMQVSPGSKYCYSFVSTRVSDAEKDLEVMKSSGFFPKDYYGFYLYTVFVPENAYAYDWCWAGNTGDYTGDDPLVPDGALEYQRCCTAYRADGMWHISIGGTGW